MEMINVIISCLVHTGEDFRITFLKPGSSYHSGKVIALYEDAYGAFDVSLVTLEDYQVEDYGKFTPEQITEIKSILKV